MNAEQFEIIGKGKGFIAALDQSGGSTPKALRLYGIHEDEYSNEDEMFDLMHKMRTRIITNHEFNSNFVIGAILFEQTMDRQIEGKYTADYLWEDKHIVPFLKIDKGLAEQENGVQLMKEITDLDGLLARAKERHIFGTKMRSVIKEANPEGIKAVVDQQFELAKKIIAADLVPIIEPEVDIRTPNKEEAEEILIKELRAHLKELGENEYVMLKVTLPEDTDAYYTVMKNPNVLRVVALSGGYSRGIAVAKLSKNQGMIASFSRALTEGLSKNMDDRLFSQMLKEAVQSIAKASNT